MVLQPLLDGAQVHRMLDDLMVIGNVQFVGVHWRMERPSELMLPDRLDHILTDELQLVGVSSTAWLRDEGWLDLKSSTIMLLKTLF